MYMNCDKNRKLIFASLKSAGIYVGTEKYQDFYNFLNNDANNYYLQLFYILCSGHFNYEDACERLVDMIKEIEFQQNSYSYSQLFQLDNSWYEYFKENAYPTGQRRFSGDKRRGVDKEYVDDLTILKKKLQLPLDDSIHWITHLKIKILTLGDNK